MSNRTQCGLMESLKDTIRRGLYFRNTFSKEEISKILKDEPPKSFIVRPSERFKDSLVLSLKTEEKIRHYLLNITDEGCWVEVEGGSGYRMRAFSNMDDLFTYFDFLPVLKTKTL